MSGIECQPLIPEVKGLGDGVLTVGRHLILNCKGDAGIFAFDKASFKTDVPVKLFKAASTAGSDISLDMTFYSAGTHQLKDLVLTDGITEIAVNGPPVKFESVLKPPGKDGKPQEPFGPILPMTISVPMLYYLIVLGIIVTVAVVAVFRARRLSFYRRLKLKLKQYESPVSPDTQFYKTIRQAEKLDYPLEKVETAFRLYVLRAYSLPTFDLSDERLIRYFKRNSAAHKNTRTSLQKLFGEFEELRKKPNASLSIDDRREFVKKLYRFVDTNKGLDL